MFVNKKYDVQKETMCDLYINNYCKSYVSMVYNDDIFNPLSVPKEFISNFIIKNSFAYYLTKCVLNHL